MKHILSMVAALLLTSCSPDNNGINAQTMNQKLYITISDDTQSVTLVDNAATQQLVSRLQSGDIDVVLDTNGSFEIWGTLGFALPTSNQQITAQPGDVILYSGSNICIFCGTNSWSYTRLGHIDGLSADELREFLKIGQNDVAVKLSLSDGATTILQAKASDNNAISYSMTGSRADSPTKGVNIRNGKKILLKN
ncbi:MAG: hypothetical protein E7070_06555 [Bacteroidales bacterium]|nr:hypothetical protein [Bacteroidales bacterium]